MWPGHMGGFGWGSYLLGGLLMLLFWGGIIALAFFAIRGIAGSVNRTSGQSESDSDRSMEILKERYARGEIDREQFQKMKSDLES